MWRYYAMICLLVEAGCRIGECLDLMMSDVDLKVCKLTFRETKGKTWRSVPNRGAGDLPSSICDLAQALSPS